jgi:hypothetical protein
VKLKDDDGSAVSPRFYNYDSYEKGGVGVLLFSSYAWGEMPTDIREDEERAIGAKLQKSINKELPKRYSFKCYWVED